MPIEFTAQPFTIPRISASHDTGNLVPLKRTLELEVLLLLKQDSKSNKNKAPLSNKTTLSSGIYGLQQAYTTELVLKTLEPKQKLWEIYQNYEFPEQQTNAQSIMIPNNSGMIMIITRYFRVKHHRLWRPRCGNRKL